MGQRIGYARVSTDDQNLDLQHDALRKAGIADDRLYSDTASGKDAIYADGVLTVNHTVASDHLVGTGNAPTATSAHANVTAVSITGRDTACEVSFAIINAPTAGSLLTITWARQFTSEPVSVVGVKAGSVIVNWSGSDTTLTIKSGTDPWPEGLYTITVITVGV